jgi:hypothetical protein
MPDDRNPLSGNFVGITASAVSNLDDLVKRALDFIESSEPRISRHSLSVVGVQITTVDRRWAQHYRVDAAKPVVIVSFALAGDRNVVDAVMQDGTPVAWDYH